MVEAIRIVGAIIVVVGCGSLMAVMKEYLSRKYGRFEKIVLLFPMIFQVLLGFLLLPYPKIVGLLLGGAIGTIAILILEKFFYKKK